MSGRPSDGSSPPDVSAQAPSPSAQAPSSSAQAPSWSAQAPSWSAQAPYWAPWCAAPATAGVFTDFDGTLSAMVEDPATAVPVPGAKQVLGTLSAALGCVAVVSGRPVAYLEKHLGDVPGLHLVGLYGMESLRDGRKVVSAEARQWEPVVAQVLEAARAVVPAGVELEPKGLSVALHARRQPEQLEWALEWARDTAMRSGLVASPGRMSVELLPPVGTDKGLVVAELSAGLEAVAFIGDDTGDLPAFAALEDMRGRGVQTLAVAAASPESPEALSRGADVVVDGPKGALALLQALAAHLA